MRDFDVNIAKGLISAATGADGFSSLYFTCPRNLTSSNEQATAQNIKQCIRGEWTTVYAANWRVLDLLTYLRCILNPAREAEA
jgi:hypothetical protein